MKHGGLYELQHDIRKLVIANNLDELSNLHSCLILILSTRDSRNLIPGLFDPSHIEIFSLCTMRSNKPYSKMKTIDRVIEGTTGITILTVDPSGKCQWTVGSKC
jgi:hypothetical protein